MILDILNARAARGNRIAAFLAKHLETIKVSRSTSIQQLAKRAGDKGYLFGEPAIRTEVTDIQGMGYCLVGRKSKNQSTAPVKFFRFPRIFTCTPQYRPSSSPYSAQNVNP